jgi:diguanylate cyclase (GGDEF)-like protein/PAS domain S-box-containing protein
MSKKSMKILLLVEDNPGDARLLREMFQEAGSHNTELTHVRCMSDAEKHLAEREVDIILLDLGLPDAQGLGAIRRAHAAAPHVPLVVLAGLDDESLATQALQEGAQDYLIKGQLDTRGLLRALRYAIERKLMEEALLVEKKRVELQAAALEATANGVVITNQTGTIVWVNFAFEHLTGYTAAGIVGQSTRVLKSGQHSRAIYEEMWLTILGGRIWRGELINRRKDGSLYYEEMTITPVQDRKGEITHYIAIKQDISERRRVEAKLLLLTERLSLATGVAKLGVWEWDLASNAFTWDAAMFEIYGFPRVVPMPYAKWSAAVYPEHLPAVEATWRKAIDERSQGAVEFRIISADGAIRNVSAVGRVVLDEHANVSRVLGIAQDITERKEAEEALFAEKERAQVTLNCIGEAVICTDIWGNITFLNLVAEKMTGWSRQEAGGRPMAEVFRILDAANREPIPNPMGIAGGQNETVHLPTNSILIRRDGREIPIEDCVSPIHDREGQATGAVIVFRDVSAARAMAQQMSHSAQHDFLTGLPNRVLVNDRVNQAIAFAQRRSKKVGVLFLDLDGFKHINDSLGHAIGDKLLQSVAKRLLDCVRGSDTVSRQGGDEFVVLLSEVELSEDAAITARRMLELVAEAHSIDQHDLHVTTSIGVSVYPDDGLDAETLVKNADTAMYQAKENGRQSYQFFKPAMNVRAVERQSIEEGLRRALERQEFVVHYQPKIDLKTGEITGAEALLRWTHPTRGLVPPAQFIPVAEDCGLILPIGNWILREACKQARAWLDAGLPLTTIAVNISAMEFRGEHFLEGVFAILDDTGLDPRYLELELTESVLMKHAESTESILKALRTRGVQLAVDDFGTGYSSLSYLRKFPINSLKIDQSFVRQITATPDDTAIVTAVISMGRSLGMRVVAEGVETQEELAFLQAHDCEEAQGYYFSRPVPPQQFAKLLETGLTFNRFSAEVFSDA